MSAPEHTARRWHSFDLRMMSQIDLTNAERDFAEPIVLGCFVVFDLLTLVIFIPQKHGQVFSMRLHQYPLVVVHLLLTYVLFQIMLRGIKLGFVTWQLDFSFERH
jgi:hypothetical protein